MGGNNKPLFPYCIHSTKKYGEGNLRECARGPCMHVCVKKLEREGSCCTVS